MTVVKGEVMLFTCLLHAIPVPTIIWTKNDQLLVPSDRLENRALLVDEHDAFVLQARDE